MGQPSRLKDGYPTKSLTCVQHPLDVILNHGFTAGHGSSRPAKRIETAAVLACISLETCQNEMHGGQAIPAFDFYLAPYVRMSYQEEVKNLEKLTGEDLSNLYDAPIDDYIEKPLDGLQGRERLEQHAINKTVNRVHQAMEAFIHNMNTIHSRGGNQVVFSSINYGTDTSAEGRCIMREILQSTYQGVGNGETAIFPIQIWKKKRGVNYLPEDRNYDLYKLACKVTARRFFPNFLNLDATFNQNEKWRADDPERYKWEIATMGCLSQRYQKELEKEMPEVDKFYGKFNYKQLLQELGKAEVSSCNGQRHLTTPRHYAYIKIAEGCNRHCAYCAIPIITGKHVSRPKEEILQEVRELVAEGVKEFQIIAQELTYYGVDIDGKHHITELISEMADIPGVKWIRLHYAYPNQFPMDLLDVMREKPNVCKYLDIALQHISDHMLTSMHRHVTKQETINLLKAIRELVPGIHIRTTLMVGFPGETDEDFHELLDFVREQRFERMGAFAYSEEEGTYSATHYEDNVPAEVKQRRLDELMILQQDISSEIEADKVGKTMTVIIDRKEGDYYIGRTEFCSPEVDPEVLIRADEKRLRVGCFYQVEITASEEFDLYGKVVK